MAKGPLLTAALARKDMIKKGIIAGVDFVILDNGSVFPQ
jgi:hypothetical protein